MRDRGDVFHYFFLSSDCHLQLGVTEEGLAGKAKTGGSGLQVTLQSEGGAPGAASQAGTGEVSAQALLNLGDSYRQNKLLDKALIQYHKLVEKYPDTSAARSAKERIAEIERESAGNRK